MIAGIIRCNCGYQFWYATENDNIQCVQCKTTHKVEGEEYKEPDCQEVTEHEPKF